MVDLIDKIPPQNLEAERSVLGAMLIEKEAIAKAIDFLREGSFYSETHQKIFQAIIDIYDKNKAVDFVTVAEELKKAKLLKEVGGATYLSNLIDSVATAANVEYYAKIVQEKAVLRNLIRVATQIVTDSYTDTKDVSEILDQAERAIFGITQSKVQTGFIPVSEMVHGSIETIESLYKKKEKVPGVPSGFIDLDRKTGGFYASNLIVVAGRPSMGKTSFCLSVARNVGVNESLPVAIFSLEMSREELVLRLLCSMARVSVHKVRTGFIDKKDWTPLTNAASVLSNVPIFIDDSPAISVLEMKARTRRLQSERGLSLIIIDYLQLMPGRTGRSEYRQQDISEITRSLKSMAKELKVPVIAISQLSRETEKRTSKRPQLSDLRESGAIEQDADLVAFIYREDYYDAKNALPGVTEIIIGKQRNGPTGSVKLKFLNEYTSFENLTKQPE